MDDDLDKNLNAVVARADALMQRRHQGEVRGEPSSDLPVLTEVVSSETQTYAALSQTGTAAPSDFLLYTQTGSIVTLTLNRPEERNALTSQNQWDALTDACQRIQGDLSVKAVILTGAGSAFCAGGNVKDFRDKRGLAAGTPVDVRENYRRGIQKIPLALQALDVPTIAAVNGPAIGAGCDLACMCDIRIAGESARFAESFVKLGLIPGDGGAWLLQRVVGYAKAAELSFTGNLINAQEAARIGLVSYVVPDEALLATAYELAERIAANPVQALRMTKRLMREAQTCRLDQTLELAAAYQALTHHSAEHDQAVADLLSRRRPD